MTSIERLSEMAVEGTITAVNPLSTPPSAPATVTITARNLGILIQWSKVPGADGYNLLINSTADMSAPERQVGVLGQDSSEYFYNTGHTATTKYIAVQSRKGSRLSDYTAPQSATTTEAQAASSFPVDATFNATETTVATVSLDTTGGTMFIQGRALLSQDGGEKTVTVILKEDGVAIDTVLAVARNNSETRGWPAIVFNFSTPSVGTHVYTITAQDTQDNATCTASSIGLVVMEVPLLVMASAEAPPTAPVTPQIPTAIPGGPEIPFMGY